MASQKLWTRTRAANTQVLPESRLWPRPTLQFQRLSVIITNQLPVINGRGRYLDNTFIERPWRSLKQEPVYLYEIVGGSKQNRSWMPKSAFTTQSVLIWPRARYSILCSSGDTKSGMRRNLMHLSEAAYLSKKLRSLQSQNLKDFDSADHKSYYVV